MDIKPGMRIVGGQTTWLTVTSVEDEVVHYEIWDYFAKISGQGVIKMTMPLDVFEKKAREFGA